MMEIRKLENGDHCVDMGNRWFHVTPNGDVVTVEIDNNSPPDFRTTKRRPATKKEIRFANSAVRKLEK